MYRTIYLSAAAHLFSDAELEALLEVSRRNNTRDRITGVLMYHDGSFLQVLEGEDSKVEACYARIKIDPRHKSIVRLFRGHVDGLLFPDWSMGFARPADLADGCAAGLKGLDQVIEELPRLRSTDRRAATLIRSFFICHRDYSTKLAG